MKLHPIGYELKIFKQHVPSEDRSVNSTTTLRVTGYKGRGKNKKEVYELVSIITQLESGYEIPRYDHTKLDYGEHAQEE